MLFAVAVCAVFFGVCVQVYRASSPVARWIRESRPGNPQYVRLQAVSNLTYAVPRPELEAAFPVLLAAAKDTDPMVRAQAAMALRGRPDHFAEVLPILRDMLKDSSPKVREHAILSLELFVKPGSPESLTLLPNLVAALDDPNTAVRLEACRALFVYGRLQTEARRVVPAMARIVREETGTYRLDALGYLSRMKSVPKDLEPTLRGLLNVSDANERIMARQALIQLGIPDQERDAIIQAMLASSTHNERLAAAGSLIELGKPELAISTIRDVAGGTDKGTRVRSLKWLDRLLDGPGSTERLAAAEALIQLGNADTVIPTLMEMAGAVDKGTRDRAQRLLDSLKRDRQEP